MDGRGRWASGEGHGFKLLIFQPKYLLPDRFRLRRKDMALLRWKSDYSVHVRILDGQHRAFMQALNRFHAAMLKGQGQSLAGSQLSDLMGLAREHFSTEETMMEAAKYPGLAEHQAIHQACLERVEEFAARFSEGDLTVCRLMLLGLYDWLNAHVRTEDQKYVPWLEANGAV
jgi:hemerythrin